MVDLLGSTKRTHKCGELRGTDIDKIVTVMGFVSKYRNLGNLLFIDVRDISGLVQVSFDDQVDKKVFEKATTLRTEYVVAITGKVRSRGANINKNLPTDKTVPRGRFFHVHPSSDLFRTIDVEATLYTRI